MTTIGSDQRSDKPTLYEPEVELELLGKRIHVLELSHEISPTIPIYPGHQKMAMWNHLTYAESRLRLPADVNWSYAVTGITMADHTSTHLDAVSHLNEERPDLSIDTVSFATLITPAVWADLSFVPARTHITLDDVKTAIAAAGIDGLPRGGTFLYWTGAERLWQDPMRFNTQYPGLDAEASAWILDQGVVNVGTDAASTDTPADPYYPNHRVHSERMINHTEMVANMSRIPRHQDFYTIMLPLRFEGATGSPVRALALWED